MTKAWLSSCSNQLSYQIEESLCLISNQKQDSSSGNRQGRSPALRWFRARGDRKGCSPAEMRPGGLGAGGKVRGHPGCQGSSEHGLQGLSEQRGGLDLGEEKRLRQELLQAEQKAGGKDR